MLLLNAHCLVLLIAVVGASVKPRKTDANPSSVKTPSFKESDWVTVLALFKKSEFDNKSVKEQVLNRIQILREDELLPALWGTLHYPENNYGVEAIVKRTADLLSKPLNSDTLIGVIDVAYRMKRKVLLETVYMALQGTVTENSREVFVAVYLGTAASIANWDGEFKKHLLEWLAPSVAEVLATSQEYVDIEDFIVLLDWANDQFGTENAEVMLDAAHERFTCATSFRMLSQVANRQNWNKQLKDEIVDSLFTIANSCVNSYNVDVQHLGELLMRLPLLNQILAGKFTASVLILVESHNSPEFLTSLLPFDISEVDPSLKLVFQVARLRIISLVFTYKLSNKTILQITRSVSNQRKLAPHEVTDIKKLLEKRHKLPFLHNVRRAMRF